MCMNTSSFSTSAFERTLVILGLQEIGNSFISFTIVSIKDQNCLECANPTMFSINRKHNLDDLSLVSVCCCHILSYTFYGCEYTLDQMQTRR